MAYVVLAVAIVASLGLVVGGAFMAGVGGVLVALAFLGMLFMAVMSVGKPQR
jgi:hypothetical protein